MTEWNELFQRLESSGLVRFELSSDPDGAKEANFPNPDLSKLFSRYKYLSDPPESIVISQAIASEGRRVGSALVIGRQDYFDIVIEPANGFVRFIGSSSPDDEDYGSYSSLISMIESELLA